MSATAQSRVVLLFVAFLMVTGSFYRPAMAGSDSPRRSLTALAEPQQVYAAGVIDRIEVVRYDTLDAALAAISTGQADLLGHRLLRANFSMVDSYPGVKKQWMHDTIAEILTVNCAKYPLNNYHLRRAIAYATDKVNITDSVMNGTVDVADFLLPLGSQYSPEATEGGLFYQSNIVAAQSELAQAGMLDVDEDGMVEAPNGSEIVFTIAAPADNAAILTAAQVIAENMRSAGLNTTVVTYPFTWLQEALNNHTIYYDLAIYELEFPDYDPGWAITTLHSKQRGVVGENIPNFADTQVNQVAEDYETGYTVEERVDAVLRGLTLLRDLAPMVPLFFYRTLSVYTDANLIGWPNDTRSGAFSVWTPVSVQPREGKESVLKVAVLPEFFTDFFTSLNPFKSGHVLSSHWLWKDEFNPYLLVYDTPIATAPDGSPVPREATSWRMVLPGMAPDLGNNESRVVFMSDQNANFTDGTGLYAVDYKFTMETYANHSLIPQADDFVGVRIIGSYVAAIDFRGVDAFLFRRLGELPILPEHIWRGKDVMSWEPSVEEAIGSGPFKVESYTPGQSLVLAANPTYYPEIDTEPPELVSYTVSPDDPIPVVTVELRIHLHDRSIIDSVVLTYSFDRGSVNFTESTEMEETPGGYVAEIPAHLTATFVEYYVNATDIWGNSAVVLIGGYRLTTHQQQEGPDPLLLAGAVGALGVAVVLLVIRQRKRS
ncbi:MAG: ABC transporter substrate-binding protein [Candidatus Thorarchaeota archaeon]